MYRGGSGERGGQGPYREGQVEDPVRWRRLLHEQRLTD